MTTPLRHSSPGPRLRSSAFTLVELLVVITIIGVLVGISMPVLRGSKIKALEAKSLSNLRQVAGLVLIYTNENGFLPGDTSPPYCNRLYPYIAGSNTGEPLGEGTEDLKKLENSVFVSPGMTTEILKKYKLDTSFDGHTIYRQVYGINSKLDPQGTGEIRLVNFPNPSGTCLLLSCAGPRADVVENILSAGADAYNGYFQALFLDGHAEKIADKDFPRAKTNPRYLRFWRGQ